MSLPLYPAMTEQQVRYVAEAVKEIVWTARKTTPVAMPEATGICDRGPKNPPWTHFSTIRPRHIRRASITPETLPEQHVPIVTPPGGQSHSLDLELLLLCARLTVDPQAEARIRALLQQAVDWNFLITTAQQHRMLPLVYRTLARIAPNAVPELPMRRLRSAIHQNARRNLFLTAELLQVIDIFRAHEIPCIPYKGPVVASLVYGDISLRQFADLDIIVPAGMS